jgi:thiol-disulfide isomerase/thioredoxin/uncharacterized membrane protein
MSRTGCLTDLGLLIAVTCARAAGAALLPAVSEQLNFQPVADFQANTVDARVVTLADLLGKPVAVNFFASWCPACQMEIGKLRELEPEFRARGLSLIGVLVDPVETPDTVDEALRGLRQNPLPYPVLLMTPALRDVFQYEGFPATYFVTAEGTFSTTLLGNHPIDQIREIAARVVGGTPVPSPSAVAPPAASARLSAAHREWETHPLLALMPARWKQWHPLVVHFPIALLVLELAFVCAFWVRPSEHVAWSGHWLLWAAVLSFVPAVYTGIRDVGVALEVPGSAFWNGWKDRVAHLLRLESSISLHVLFVLAAVLLTTGRLVWRVRGADRALRGGQGLAFATVTALGLWLLFAAAQIGGGISHP